MPTAYFPYQSETTAFILGKNTITQLKIFMSTQQSNRRNFLRFIGLSAGASLVSGNVLAGVIEAQEIKKLNPVQQAFMVRYSQWMDEFIEAIRSKKKDPGNPENNNRIMNLTNKADAFKPELNEHMKDETFRLIYAASIERMSKEIS